MLCNKSVWARSLAGKAPRSQRGDRGFESLRVHYNKAIPFGMVLLYLNYWDSNQRSLRSLLRMASPCFAVRFRTAAKAARKMPQGQERKRTRQGWCILSAASRNSVRTGKCPDTVSTSVCAILLGVLAIESKGIASSTGIINKLAHDLGIGFADRMQQIDGAGMGALG